MTALHRVLLDNANKKSTKHCKRLLFSLSTIIVYESVCFSLNIINKHNAASIPSTCKLIYSNIRTHNLSSHLPLMPQTMIRPNWETKKTCASASLFPTISFSTHLDANTESRVSDYFHPVFQKLGLRWLETAFMFIAKGQNTDKRFCFKRYLYVWLSEVEGWCAQLKLRRCAETCSVQVS